MDENPFLYARDQIIQAGVFLPWLQRDVWHAWKGNAAPAIGMQTAVRLFVWRHAGQVARGLPINENAVLDQMPTLSRYAFVVVSDSCEPHCLSSIPTEVHV